MIPELLSIPCPRWRAAAGVLWARLPDHDRAVLAARLAGVRVRDDLDGLARAGDFEADAGGALRWWVDLAPAERVGADGDLLAILAHECAHVVLRHGEALALIGGAALLAGAYTAEELAAYNAAAELQAWAMVTWWGLGAEARAFLRRRPRIKRPAFWGT